MYKKEQKKMVGELRAQLREARRLYAAQERMMKDQLYGWLTTRSQHRANQMLRQYRPEDRLAMLNAMMRYVMMGRRTKFERPVMAWHHRLFCEMVDEDRVAVPSHALLKRLWVKIGLLQPMETE